MDMREQPDGNQKLEFGEIVLLALSMGSILAAVHFFLGSVF
ncbi:hypothetical protein [Endozoicomonas sp. OPT23]|nr:hypothetical protein [Endozoicomonas sp. OPT23]